MIKATFIKSSDLENLEKDDNGNYIIPDGIKIYIEEDPEELNKKRIAELEIELESIVEPTEEELIEEGRMMHPYYVMTMELEMLKNQLK